MIVLLYDMSRNRNATETRVVLMKGSLADPDSEQAETPSSRTQPPQNGNKRIFFNIFELAIDKSHTFVSIRGPQWVSAASSNDEPR